MEDKIRILDLLSRWEADVEQQKLESNDYIFIPRLLFKMRLVVSSEHDSAAVTKMRYIQEMNSVVTEHLFVDQSQALTLCALSLQANLGDFSELEKKAAEEHLPFVKLWALVRKTQYLPMSCLSKAQALEKEIIALHKNLKGYSKEDAMLVYLDYVAKHPLSGGTFFGIEVKTAQENLKKASNLVVTPDGLCLANHLGEEVFQTIAWNQLEVCLINWCFYRVPSHQNRQFLVSQPSIFDSYSSRNAKNPELGHEAANEAGKETQSGVDAD